MADAEHGKWDDARQVAQHAHSPLLAKLAEWLYLTEPGSTPDFGEVTRFIQQNQDWPSQGLLRRHAEDAINDGTPPAQVIDWFQHTPPQGAAGAAHYVDALVQKPSAGQRPRRQRANSSLTAR